MYRLYLSVSLHSKTLTLIPGTQDEIKHLEAAVNEHLLIEFVAWRRIYFSTNPS
jgi:hypothetical protein